MTPFKVYLAGPISGLTYDEGQDWREYAQAALAHHGIAGYSPLRQKEFLRSEGVLSQAYANPMATDRGIMRRDFNDVKTSHVVLINLLGAKSASQGTVMEMGWAYALQIPVVVAVEDAGNIHEHPMNRQTWDYRVPCLDQALAITAAILLPHCNKGSAT